MTEARAKMSPVKDSVRVGDRFRWLASLGLDVRFGARTLRKSPLATATAIVTLALGVGLNTAIFSVVKSILLNQLPFRDPSRIVTIAPSSATNANAEEIGGWTIEQWRRRGRSFDSISSYGDGQLTLVENGQAEVLRGMRVSGEFFQTLGVQMQLGRAFDPDDVRAHANVVIFNHNVWKQRFAADPAMVGRTLELNGAPYRVIGVLPPDFEPLRMTNAAELPQVFALADYSPTMAEQCHSCFGGRVIARLSREVSVGEARAEVDAIMQRIARENPAERARDTSLRVTPLMDQLIGPIRRTLWTLFGAVGLVLLIACGNVASLQLARATSRAREFAVRAALGSGRGRLAVQLLIENVLLAGAGGAAGIFVGSIGTSAIVALAPRELPRVDEIHVDAAVLLVALSVSVVTGLVFGVAPAWFAGQTDVNASLKKTAGISGRSAGAGLRNALVVVDLALAFVLIVATGLLGRSIANLKAVDAGFEADNVLTMTTTIVAGGYPSTASRLDYYRRLVARVEAVPGVLAAGMTSNVPLSHAEPVKVRIEGEAPIDAATPSANTFLVSPGYFQAMGIRLTRGRVLMDDDGTAATPGVVISESLARARFPNSDPIGRRIQFAREQQVRPWSVVVGIVGDVRFDSLDQAARQAVYEPQAVNPFHYTRLVARTAGNPWRFERAIREAMREVDPAQTVFHVQPMSDYVSSSLADRRFTLSLIASFAMLALLLSAVGLYGLISYSVVQRTAEIGVRAALGASRANLFALVLRQSLALTLVGLTVGALAGAVGTRLIAGLLFGVTPSDPATLVAAATLLAAVAACASGAPAHAATRIDPLAALRSE